MIDELVRVMLDELESRSGFDHWWDSLDEDIQAEIRDALRRRVAEVVETGSG